MKFNDYMVKKTSPLNESSSYTKINEGTEDFGAIIKGIMAYSKAASMMPNYEKAAQSADTSFIKAKGMQKKTPLELKKAMIEAKAKEADREVKKKMLTQASAIEAQIDKITDSEATIIQAAADEYANIKSDLDSEIGSIAPDSLKSIISKQKTLADQKAKIRGLKAMEAALSSSKDKARAEKLKGELQAAEEDYKEAMKKLDDAEDAGSDDLKEVEGVKAVEPELKAFMAAGAKFKAEKAKLQAVYDSADAIAEGESYEYSRSAEEIHELFLAELDMNEDELYEDGDEATVTPQAVLGKINACKEEERSGLYGDLKSVLPGWKAAKIAQIEAKKKIWDKVQGKPSTKSVLLVAGATDETIKEEEKDGKTVYTASEPGKKWKIAFEDPEAEGGPLAGLKEVEDKLKEIEAEPAGDDNTGGKNDPELSDKQKERLAKAKAGLAKAEEAGDKEKAARYKELIDKIGSKLGEGEDFDAFLESIDEELSFLAEDDKPAEDGKPAEEVEKKESAESAPKKIMKFEDFMTSRTNG